MGDIKQIIPWWFFLVILFNFSFGTADINPSKIHTAKGILNKQCDRATATWVSNKLIDE